MGEKTGIGWTDSTWNLFRGCSRECAEGTTQSGCGDPSGGGCYAERNGYRFAGEGLPYEGLVRMTKKGARWTGKVVFVDDHLLDPISWQEPRRIFTTSVSDPFHPKFSDETIAIAFGVMALTKRHTHQVLTKRARRMYEWHVWVEDEAEKVGKSPVVFCVELLERYLREDPNGVFTDRQRARVAKIAGDISDITWPLQNVHLGISVENQYAYQERMAWLAKLSEREIDSESAGLGGAFLSLEPLLAEVDLDPLMCPECGQWEDIYSEPIPNTEFTTQPWCTECDVECGSEGWLYHVTWAIVGCESGPRARKCETEWIRSIRDQLAEHDVPFFLKQAVEDHSMVPDITGATSVAVPAIVKGPLSDTAGIGHGGPVIEAPYLDGRQHLAFPQPLSTE